MIRRRSLIIMFLFFFYSARSQVYPDQQYLVRGGDQISNKIESKKNVYLNEQENRIELISAAKEGFFILKPESFTHPFNRGLPSWNGFAPKDQKSAFKIQMRYRMSYGWSAWVTVGFWDQNIWSSYGDTSFRGGKISVDYLKLDEYINEYQFKIILS